MNVAERWMDRQSHSICHAKLHCRANLQQLLVSKKNTKFIQVNRLQSKLVTHCSECCLFKFSECYLSTFVCTKMHLQTFKFKKNTCGHDPLKSASGFNVRNFIR